MSTTKAAEAVARYWASVQSAADSGDPKRSARAKELIRLRDKTVGLRPLFPATMEMPLFTIDTAALGGHASGHVDALGGWGQGVAITLRAARVDPFNTFNADQGLDAPVMDRSLIYGHPLLATEQEKKALAEIISLRNERDRLRLEAESAQPMASAATVAAVDRVGEMVAAFAASAPPPRERLPLEPEPEVAQPVIPAMAEKPAAPAPDSLMERVAQRIRLETEPAQPVLRKGPGIRLSKEESVALHEEIEDLCRKHGKEWPHRAATKLAARYGISKQSINSRKNVTLARLAGQPEVA